jgi:hypothetical protein
MDSTTPSGTIIRVAEAPLTGPHGVPAGGYVGAKVIAPSRNPVMYLGSSLPILTTLHTVLDAATKTSGHLRWYDWLIRISAFVIGLVIMYVEQNSNTVNAKKMLPLGGSGA